MTQSIWNTPTETDEQSLLKGSDPLKFSSGLIAIFPERDHFQASLISSGKKTGVSRFFFPWLFNQSNEVPSEVWNPLHRHRHWLHQPPKLGDGGRRFHGSRSPDALRVPAPWARCEPPMFLVWTSLAIGFLIRFSSCIPLIPWKRVGFTRIQYTRFSLFPFADYWFISGGILCKIFTPMGSIPYFFFGDWTRWCIKEGYSIESRFCSWCQNLLVTITIKTIPSSTSCVKSLF